MHRQAGNQISRKENTTIPSKFWKLPPSCMIYKGHCLPELYMKHPKIINEGAGKSMHFLV